MVTKRFGEVVDSPSAPEGFCPGRCRCADTLMPDMTVGVAHRAAGRALSVGAAQGRLTADAWTDVSQLRQSA